MAKYVESVLAALVVVVVLVLVTDVSAQPILQCLFANTSMISTTACSHNVDSRSPSRSVLPSWMLACPPFLDDDEPAPSAKCCAGVRNVSALSQPCLCKHTFYPGPNVVNHTRARLLPALCGVTSDLCRVCSAFLVDRVWEPHHSREHSEAKISSYKKKVLGLAVALGFALACMLVAIAILVRRKIKQRKTLPPVVKSLDFQSKQPGSDY